MRVVLTATMLAALSALAGPIARADETTPDELRLGMYWVQYSVHADDITGPYVPPGVNTRLDDVETLYAAYVRRLSSHFNLELAFGWPPLTKTVGKGPATLGSAPYNGQVIATARWLAPTLLLNYSFLDEASPLRPYVGAGINYTKFYDRQSTYAGDQASGGPTAISLPVSVGPAATVGLAYHLSNRWGIYASYSVSEVNSRFTADTAGVIRTAHIDFWPRALVISAGFSF
jgi:outer membrane protein